MPPQESNFSDTPGSTPVLSEIVARIEANKPTTYKEKKLAAIIEYIKSVGDKKYYKPMKTPEALPEAAPPPGTESPKPQPAAEHKPEAPAKVQDDASAKPSSVSPAGKPEKKSTVPPSSKEDQK
jgi:hypothetical protein